jgi:hypothetical protein
VKTIISQSIQKAHPNLERILWRTACIAKEYDNEITISGLFVRVTKSPSLYWSGNADPLEETVLYNKIICHPAGRVNLKLTGGMVERSVIILFAHELRHIGQFNKGRRKYGVLMTEITESDYLIEKDAYTFEKKIADIVLQGTKTLRGKEELDPILDV